MVPEWSHEPKPKLTRTPKENEVTTALGELVVIFANLEDSLRDSISILARGPRWEDGPNIVEAMTAGMNFRTLVEVFGAVGREIGAERVGLDDLPTFCGHLHGLAGERNQYIHSGWDHGIEGEPTRGFKRLATAKKGFVFNVEEVDVAEILDLSHRLDEARRKLFEILAPFMGRVYDCTFLGSGTRTATGAFDAMFEAWASPRGLRFEPGTLNLCSEVELVLPASFEALDLALAPRQGPTLSPRLYEVLLNRTQRAWLYRWSAPEHLEEWVGDTEGCPRRCHVEILAEGHLETALKLKPGDHVSVELASDPSDE